MNERIGDSILLQGFKKGVIYNMYFYNNELIGFLIAKIILRFLKSNPTPLPS
jgi:hypothetical protein